MARRPKGEQDDVSLFPFLSIIACVIGVLTLMISTLAMAQMDTQEVADAEQNEKLQDQLAQRREAVEDLRQKIAERIGPEAMEVQRKLVDTMAELQKADEKLKEIEARRAALEKVKIVIPELDEQKRETVVDMQQQLARLKEELAQLEKDLSAREDAKEAEVSILPSGSGLNFTPHFVECAAGALVLHDLEPPKRIRAADMTTDKDLIALMETIANGQNDSMIFLVRSDGLGSYRAAVNLANQNEIRFGKLPAVGKGRIDLSQFRAK